MSLSSKDPREKVVVTFDFNAVPEAISNPVINISTDGETDITSMKIGSAQVSGNIVMQLFTGGDDGIRYYVSCLVDVVDTGERFIAKDILSVKK